MHEIKRRRIWRIVDQSSVDFEGTLAQARERLNALIAKYGEAARLNYGQHISYSDSYTFVVEVESDETDEELEQRRQEVARAEEYERKLYERMRAKYEPKT